MESDPRITANPPFRTELRAQPSSPNPSASLNHGEAEELIARIRQTFTPTDDLLQAVFECSDERVLIAAIKEWGPKMVDYEGRWKLFELGRTICEAEKIVWHPLFDAMAAHDCWPWYFTTDPDGQPQPEPNPAPIEEQIRPLIRWIAQQTDWKNIEKLLEFEAYLFLELICPHIDPAWITKDVAQKLPWPALAQHPALPKPIAEWLAEHAIDVLAPKPAAQDTSELDHHKFPATATYAHSTISNLIQSNKHIRPEWIQRIIDGLAGDHREFCVMLLNELGSQVSAEQIEATFEKAPHSLWPQLINHPSVTPQLRRRIVHAAKRHGGASLQRGLSMALARDARALTDREVREYILTTETASVLENALATAATMDASIFVDILERYIELSPLRAMRTIRFTRAYQAWIQRIEREFLDILIDGILRQKNSDALHDLLWYEPTSKDPRVHEILIANPDTSINYLYECLRHARGELFRRCIDRMIRTQSPYQHIGLLTMLATEQPAGLADLEPEDLMPLIQSKRKEVRLQAITLIAQLKQRARGTTFTATARVDRPLDVPEKAKPAGRVE